MHGSVKSHLLVQSIPQHPSQRTALPAPHSPPLKPAIMVSYVVNVNLGAEQSDRKGDDRTTVRRVPRARSEMDVLELAYKVTSEVPPLLRHKPQYPNLPFSAVPCVHPPPFPHTLSSTHISSLPPTTPLTTPETPSPSPQQDPPAPYKTSSSSPPPSPPHKY